ncbi:hypothetical protein RQY88_004252 [Vibrio vulnificus]|nr:hypothetical protein [Vibrio vulnificus]ELH9603010.1 hypothetical protein [Vibrio vulnificus]ELH9617273.1 hypothetical protein [Vibrio vulnificus]
MIKGGLQWLLYCVAHPLTGRYVAFSILVFISSCLWPTARGRFGCARCGKHYVIETSVCNVGSVRYVFPTQKRSLSLVDLNLRALVFLSTQFREPLWVIWLRQDS